MAEYGQRIVMTMHRRDFGRIMPVGALLAGHSVLGSARGVGADPGPVLRRPAIQGLSHEAIAPQDRDALVIDALVTTRGWSEDSWRIAMEAGLSGLGTSLSSGSMEAALGDLATWNQRIEADPDRYLLADGAGALERAHATGELAVLLGFQNTTITINDPEISGLHRTSSRSSLFCAAFGSTQAARGHRWCCACATTPWARCAL